MKVLHVGRSIRASGNKGGTEKLAYYLQQVIGCELITIGQLGSTDLSRYDAVIADDALASEVANSVQRGTKVISIIHGSWMEFAIRNGKVLDFQGEANAQGSTWTRDDIVKVAASESAAHYARKHHGVQGPIYVVLNAVDVDLFKPIVRDNKRPIVIHAATDYNKTGQGKLDRIIKLLPDFEFRFLDAKIGEEHIKFAQGDMFIQCSHYEGNSFAALEAMSCGLPVVASRAGLFELTDFGIHEPGEIVDWDASAEAFVYALQKCWIMHHLYTPRLWVMQNASLDKFKENWLGVLNA